MRYGRQIQWIIVIREMKKNKEMKTYCETQTKNFPNEKISHQWILAKQRNTMNRDLPIV